MRECSPPRMCHMSRVTCQVLHVRCHMSRVTCHVSHVTCPVPGLKCPIFYSILIFFGQRSEASPWLWRVCYLRGLPRLGFGAFKKNGFPIVSLKSDLTGVGYIFLMKKG